MGRMEDLDLLEDICDNVFGRVFCALGDGMTSPIVSSLKYFMPEYEQHVRQGRCPLGTTPPSRELPVLETTTGAGYLAAALAAPTSPAVAGGA